MAHHLKDRNRQIDALLALILSIRGMKILTLTYRGKVFEVDLDEEGFFGYEEFHKSLFLEKLGSALEGGALVIREFLNVKTKKILSSGKEIWIPEKNLYGIFFHEGEWFGLSAEALQESYRTNAKSGEALPLEEGVHYRSLEMHSFSED